MAVSLREYRARIKSTESMKKITRAMELIAASRIIKAQQRAQQAAPYARELTRAVSALVTFSNTDHPLTTEPEDPKKAAILIVTSDRGLAGAYSSSVLKEGERRAERLRGEGKEVVTYPTGRNGEAPSKDDVLPLYEFEPSPEEVLDELLPKYVQSRIFFALLQASASELAARQKAMKSATDNAEELIKKYTRIANQARQAGITQEISEIVGGVNALADANAASE